MKLYHLPLLLSSVTLVYGLHIRGSGIKQSSVGIIDGKKASIKDFPFMVSITQAGEFFGAGVILNEHWILSSALTIYGVNKEEITIRIGSASLSKGKLVTVEKVVIPSNYTGSWPWDIGLVKVKKPIKFSKSINKIDLGSGELKNGTEVTIAGWGSTAVDYISNSGILRSATLTVLDRKTCSSITSGVTSKMFCTFDDKSGPGLFDFGDPVIVNDEVYGVFIGADDEIPGKYPSIYTDVSKYKTWIEENIST